jgi:hypothetical protein
VTQNTTSTASSLQATSERIGGVVFATPVVFNETLVGVMRTASPPLSTETTILVNETITEVPTTTWLTSRNAASSSASNNNPVVDVRTAAFAPHVLPQPTQVALAAAFVEMATPALNFSDIVAVDAGDAKVDVRVLMPINPVTCISSIGCEPECKLWDAAALQWTSRGVTSTTLVNTTVTQRLVTTTTTLSPADGSIVDVQSSETESIVNVTAAVCTLSAGGLLGVLNGDESLPDIQVSLLLILAFGFRFTSLDRRDVM